MKKLILSLTLLIVLTSTIFIFAACSSSAPVPGVSWATTETLKYDIIDSANNNVKIGFYETSIEKLIAADNYVIDKIPNQKFKISTNVLKGFRYKETAKDLNDAILMETESIFDGFNVIGSYKKVYANSLNITPYETIIILEDGKFKITINGESKPAIKSKGNITPNELIYNAVRPYSELDDSFSTSLAVIDPTSGKTLDINIATTSDRENIKFNYSNNNSELTATEQPCIKVKISKGSAPIGKIIEAWYTPASFKISGSLNLSNSNYSIHIPAKIVENNLVYLLTEARAV
ncbi:MAG: hypothetical protein LBF12_00830 [Christensenellaceae bacterium]|jgi:hypothetical protein|nr:hypothetical protein [Christensenellaceae bacterium]